MCYKAELNFLREVLGKLRLQTTLLYPGGTVNHEVDHGLRLLLGRKDDYERSFLEIAKRMESNAVWKLLDPFLCCYVFLRLPERGQPTLLIGPYLKEEVTHQQLLEEAERFRISPRLFRQMEECFGRIPVLSDERYLSALLESFGESVWGSSEAFSVVDINLELQGTPLMLGDQEDPPSPEETERVMQRMEERYAMENAMMSAVSQGQVHKTELLLKGFSRLSFQSRVSDPVRNMKNYCIIMNTLLRKAAEQGGVHPVYLDRMSSSFAQKIEQLSSQVAVGELMEEMFRTYCRLVRHHSVKNYSRPVQRAMIHIDSDLTADLSLRALAEIQKINASYLSNLFRKETGHTVTDYVNGRRVDHAAHLLRSTRLQIQTVAQHSGIPDVNYFSKIFKKYTGMTPKAYRGTM